MHLFIYNKATEETTVRNALICTLAVGEVHMCGIFIQVEQKRHHSSMNGAELMLHVCACVCAAYIHAYIHKYKHMYIHACTHT